MSVCEKCGRRGTRGFVLLRGTGDGGYGDQWVCASGSACGKRARRAEFTTGGRSVVPGGLRELASPTNNPANPDPYTRDLNAALDGLAALEQERDEAVTQRKAAEEWARVIEHERDFEQQVVVVDLRSRLEDAERERDTLRAALRLYLGKVANQIGTERRCSCFARDDPDHGPACCCGDEAPDALGWHVVPGTLLLESLTRCESGESADLVYAELWANARHDQVGETEDE